jgi:hypothetical protein
MKNFEEIVITREELEGLFNGSKGKLKNVFKGVRSLSKKRGLSYDENLGIRSWFDVHHNLRQCNFVVEIVEEEVIN